MKVLDVIEYIPMDKKVSLRALTGYGREAKPMEQPDALLYCECNFVDAEVVYIDAENDMLVLWFAR